MPISKRLTSPPTIERAKRDKQNPSFIGSSYSQSAWGMGQIDNLAAYTSWSYACIDLIANALSDLEVSITRRKGRSRDERQEVEADHWLARLIDDPNPEYEPSTLWRLAAKWFLINGNAYLYTPRYGEQYPQEIWVLPSNRVSVVPGNKGERLVRGYLYYHDGQPFGIDAEEVVHWKNLEPSSDLRSSFYVGRSPINAASRAISVDIQNQEFLARFFGNDALPAFVITQEAEMQPDQWEIFKGRWNDTFMGSSNAGKWGLLDGGKSIDVLSSNGKIEEATRLDESNRKRVCTIWGLSDLALTGDANARAVLETIDTATDKRAVRPRAKSLGEALTRLGKRFESDAGLQVRYKPYQYNDPAEQRENNRFLVSIGYPPNRIFEELGLEPVEGGDVSLFNGTPLNQLIAESEQEEQVVEEVETETETEAEEEPEEELEDEAPTTKALTRATESPEERTLYAYWKRYDSLNESAATRIAKQVAKGFTQLEEEVLATLASSKSLDGFIAKDGVESTSNLFDLKAWMKKFATLAAPELRRHITRVSSEAITDANASPDDYKSSFAKRVDKLLEKSTGKITTTVGTAKKQLEELLKANRTEPVARLTELIQQKFQHYTTSSAAAVAQTTATYATGASQKEAWKMLEDEDDQIETIERVWLTQRDGSVRDSHKKADGQVAKDGEFRVGRDTMDSPGGGSVAEENVNCRCVTRPRIKRRKG